MAYRSVDEVRQQHSTLLQRRRSSGALTESDMLDFIKSVSETGRLLPESEPDARESARGILDYWTASLLSLKPQLAREAPSYLLLQPYQKEGASALSTEFQKDDEALSEIIREAKDLTQSLSKKQHQLLCKLLLRFVHLKKDSVEAYTSLVQPTDFEDSQEKSLCEELLKRGILQTRQEDGMLSLRHERLVTDWPFLAERLKRRRDFREWAVGWRKGGRSDVALLERGDELNEAIIYSDLEPYERDFLEKSRTRGGKIWYRLLGAALTCLLLVGGLSLWLAESNTTLQKQSEKLVENNKKLDQDKRDLMDALKIVRNGSQQAVEYKAKADLLERIVMQFVKTVPQTAWPSSLQAKDFIEQYKVATRDDTKTVSEETTQAPLAQSLSDFDPSANQVLQPGNSIFTKTKAGESRGSLGIFVRDQHSNIFIVSPTYLFSGDVGKPVFAGRGEKAVQIGIISSLASRDVSDLSNLSLVKVSPGLQATNAVSGIGQIQSLESSPKIGMEVILIGSGSGLNEEGKIAKIWPDGTVIIDRRISKPGDEGAPVISKAAKKLIGLLISSTGESSLVKPIQSLLTAHNMKLYQAPTNDFSGVLAEIFVSAEDKNFIASAAKYVGILQKVGIRFPVSEPQPRNKVPTGKSEVRYFYDDEENKALAEKVMSVLKQHGFKDSNLRVSLTRDPTAPRKFIQISLAKNAPGLVAP